MNIVPSLEDDLLRCEAIVRLYEAINALPPRSKIVISDRFGLEDGRELTLKEIAQKFGVCNERIRQIEYKAMRELRKQKAVIDAMIILCGRKPLRWSWLDPPPTDSPRPRLPGCMYESQPPLKRGMARVSNSYVAVNRVDFEHIPDHVLSQLEQVNYRTGSLISCKWKAPISKEQLPPGATLHHGAIDDEIQSV